jgi:hypothetical protein
MVICDIDYSPCFRLWASASVNLANHPAIGRAPARASGDVRFLNSMVIYHARGTKASGFWEKPFAFPARLHYHGTPCRAP